MSDATSTFIVLARVERIVDAETCRYTLALMTTAGLYETAGDWLYEIGLPGRSGIGGGIASERE